MARTVNIHEAKTHFSQLVEAAERGEEIVIARRGKPVLKLVPVHVRDDAARPKRKLGWSKGKFWYSPDFDENFEKLFEDRHPRGETPR